MGFLLGARFIYQLARLPLLVVVTTRGLLLLITVHAQDSENSFFPTAIDAPTLL